ncbi:MAG: Holliday junction branch migration protein RuvA [Acidimicrobiia bacterium]
MIGRLRGHVAAIRGERVVVDVHGFGFEVVMHAKGMAALPGIAEPVMLHTHLHAREDGLTLYGFDGEADRDLFRVLLGASGVGPKVAMAILGVFSADALRTVIASEDVDALTRVPGVGKRGAQKIILDLRPKLADLEADVLEGGSDSALLRQALESLGYAPAEIRAVAGEVDAGLPLADQVRQALRSLAR